MIEFDCIHKKKIKIECDLNSYVFVIMIELYVSSLCVPEWNLLVGQRDQSQTIYGQTCQNG